jgi:amino acid transporter
MAIRNESALRCYQMKGMQLPHLRRSLGAIEAFGFSLSIIAPTLAMAFTTTLAAQSAGRAAPLVHPIGGIIVTIVGLSFVEFGRRVAHAGSVSAYVGSVFGSRSGFFAGWALLLAYVTLLAGATALVGNFGAAALGRAGVEWPHLWLMLRFWVRSLRSGLRGETCNSPPD